MSHDLKKMTDIVWDLINADSWSDSQEIVEREHERLLSEEADLVLNNLLEKYQDDEHMTIVLEDHQDLLKACKAEGIDNAFKKKISEAIPLGLSPELTTRMLSIRSEADMNELVENHPDVQAVLNKIANATRFALTSFMDRREKKEEKTQKVKLTSDTLQTLANKLKIFISIETIEDTDAYLEEHPELVTKEGLAVMEILVQRAKHSGDRETINLFTFHYDILSDALDERLDIELTELFSETAPINIWDALNELTDCENHEEILDTIEEYPELLSETADKILEQSIVHSRIQGHLGGPKWAEYLQARRTTLRKIREKLKAK